MVAKCGGFSTWVQTTPGGNEIWHDEGSDYFRNTIFCRHSISVDFNKVCNLEKWYFYKNRIIGCGFKKDSCYIIFDESNGEYKAFENKEEFEKQLKLDGLEPCVCTRWYKTNWGMFITSGDFGQGLWLIILFPSLLALMIAIIASIIKFKLYLKRRFYEATLLMVVCVLIRILLDIYPRSF